MTILEEQNGISHTTFNINNTILQLLGGYLVMYDNT